MRLMALPLLTLSALLNAAPPLYPVLELLDLLARSAEAMLGERPLILAVIEGLLSRTRAEVPALGANTEAAAVRVLLVDRLGPLADGHRIAIRSRAIALQSVAWGIGLSVAGMIAAALGWLTPVQGALLQEAIDVAVILNALRALRIDVTADRPDSTAAMALPRGAG